MGQNMGWRKENQRVGNLYFGNQLSQKKIQTANFPKLRSGCKGDVGEKTAASDLLHLYYPAFVFLKVCLAPQCRTECQPKCNHGLNRHSCSTGLSQRVLVDCLYCIVLYLLRKTFPMFLNPPYMSRSRSGVQSTKSLYEPLEPHHRFKMSEQMKLPDTMKPAVG